MAKSNDPRQVPHVADEVTQAAKHLSESLRGRLRGARITVRQGGAVIQGTTNSYSVKQLAQHAVMKWVSLPITANEIEVHH